MIFQPAAGYHVRLWTVGGPVLEWGAYPTWADAFAVEQRAPAELQRQRERPPRKPPPPRARQPRLLDA